MSIIKTLIFIISCTLLFMVLANTTATAAITNDNTSNTVSRVGMASSSSNRMLTSRLSCDNGGCIGMASSSS